MRKALIAAVLLAVSIGIVLYVGPDEHRSLTEPATGDAASAASIAHSAGETIPADTGMDAASTEVPPDAAEPTDCLRFRVDESHPWIIAETARIESLAPSGPGMAVYRGLAEDDLLSLAAQKDSGAMIVLAKRAELRAEGRPEDEAVDQLDGQRTVVLSRSNIAVEEEDKQRALVEAEHWYYQAALHGRLFAMFHVGMLRSRLNGGPVGLGWVDEEAYAEMDSGQRERYIPDMVYGAAATALAPEVMLSPMMTLALENLGLNEPAADPATLQTVVSEFLLDLERNGLPLPSIPPYAGPGIDAWRAEFCSD